MLDFLLQNAATIVIGVVLLAIVTWIVVSLKKDKKSGKAVGCGCGCENCPSSSMCHKK